MSPRPLSSTSRALFRVFIAPALHAPPPRPLGAPLPPCRPRPALSCLRWISFVRRDTSRHAITDHYTLDKAIRFPFVDFVDSCGQFRHGWATAEINYNPTTHHLLLVNPGKQDEFGNQDPDNLPLCKVVSRIELRTQHEKKLSLERKKQKGLTATGSAPKNMELNWAISSHDLSHRLTKLKQFLQEGRKVDVLFGSKRRGKKATTDECGKVLEHLRAMVDGVKGAREVKDPEGTLGGVMTFVFEGTKMKEPKKALDEASDQELKKESDKELEQGCHLAE